MCVIVTSTRRAEERVRAQWVAQEREARAMRQSSATLSDAVWSWVCCWETGDPQCWTDAMPTAGASWIQVRFSGFSNSFGSFSTNIFESKCQWMSSGSNCRKTQGLDSRISLVSWDTQLEVWWWTGGSCWVDGCVCVYKHWPSTARTDSFVLLLLTVLLLLRVKGKV